MNLKEEFAFLVKTVKDNVKGAGKKITNEEIAERLSIGRTYLSGLLGGSKDVTKKHIEDFKSHFRDELAGIVRPSLPGDTINRERALIKVLLQRVAKLEADRLGIPVEVVLKDISQDTMIAWQELEQHEDNH
jgi:hypothetical protein